MYVKALIKNYLPEDQQDSAHDQLMKTFLEIIAKESTSVDLKEELAVSLAGFVATEEHITWAKEWIAKRGVYSQDGNLLYTPDNMSNFLNSLLVSLYSFTSVDLEYKQKTLEEVIGDDKSDKATNLRERCRARLPDPAIKEETWKRIVAEKPEDSLVTRNSLMAGMYHRSQKEILRPYFDKFFECIESVAAS